MENASLIACTRCAISKARCDRKVPCSQCVARNYVCQPRCTSRRPRAPRKRTQASKTTSSAANLRLDTNHTAPIEQFSNYIMNDGQPRHDDLFVLAQSTLNPGPLEFSGYEDFMGFSYTGSSGSDSMAGNVTGNIYPNVPRLEIQTTEPRFSQHLVSNGGQYKQGLLNGPCQPPTPPFTSPQTVQSLPLSPLDGQVTSHPIRPTQDARMTNLEASGDVLGEMLDLLARPDAWNGLPINETNANTALSQDYRDRIVAIVQILLHRALQIGCSPSSSDQGLFGRIVSLPPSHVLTHFVDLYAKRIESIQPYLGLAGSPTASIHDILQVDAADVGMLLVILVITQGAMLTDHHESHVFAHGLIEVCRVALNHVLERRSISDPMVGGIALQLLTLCARSGKDSFNSFSMAKRGQYMSMLKETGILQPEQGYHEQVAGGKNPWEEWKAREQRNRHAYAWVYVDLETSLLHDVPPILSIGDLQVPLPRNNDLWHAPSYNAWAEQPGANEIQLGHEMPSLNGLFRSFLQGQLTVGDDTPLHHLRLLLHPLQAMILEQQQLLRIFDTDEPSNRYRVLSKIKVLGRLQETQDLVQDLTVLLKRHLHAATDNESDSQTRATDCLSIIMLHLVSLNVFTSIPDIERCAKEEPPVSEMARTAMWRRVRYPEGESYVLFHAGQIFRLIDSLPIDLRPTWWPVAIYRASVACWSLRSVEQQASSRQAREVSIDTLSPSEEERFLNTSTGIPVVTFSDRRRLPILEQNNSLLYCINKLESHPTQLVSSVLDKVRYFLHRWA